MKAFVLAAVAALAATTASAADFTGVRVGVTGGYDHTLSQNGFNYGGVVGIDAPVLKVFTLGAEATLEDSTLKGEGVHAGRDIGVNARLGLKVLPNALVFGKVGYATTDVGANGTNLSANFDGFRYGGGVEVAVTKHTYATVEYRHTDYQDSLGVGRDSALVGFGFRF